MITEGRLPGLIRLVNARTKMSKSRPSGTLVPVGQNSGVAGFPPLLKSFWGLVACGFRLRAELRRTERGADGAEVADIELDRLPPILSMSWCVSNSYGRNLSAFGR